MADTFTVTAAFANINANATNSSIVNATSGAKWRIVSLVAVAGSAGTAFTLGSAGNAVSPNFTLGGNGSLVLPYNQAGWFTATNSNQNMSITTAGAAIAIQVNYLSIPSTT